MRLGLIQGACALGLLCAVSMACNKSHDRPSVSAAEQRRIDERRAEERRAEERKADAEERKAERIADERRAEERREEARREEAHRAEARREEARREEARRERLASSVDPVLRATPASAVSSLAAERCDREARCKNIGAKEKYKTRAECVAEMERDKRDDINSDVCRGGVREKELSDCLKAIREESCGNPLDAITRLAACRTGNLCAK